MKKQFLPLSPAFCQYFGSVVKFRNLLQHVHALMRNGVFQSLTTARQMRLKANLQRLYARVAAFNPSLAVKMAGATACLALVAGQAHAQMPRFEKWADGQSPIAFTELRGLHEDYGNTNRILDGVFVDMDGDGDLDAALVATNQYETSIVYFENVNGTFTENDEKNPFVDVSTDGLTSLDIRDFDGDGKLDLVTTNKKSGCFMSHYEWDADAQTYVDDGSWSQSTAFVDYTYLAAKFMDVNGDGLADLVTYGIYDDSTIKMATLYQADDHSFGEPKANKPIGDVLSGFSPYSQLAVADMDADGDDDLFLFFPEYEDENIDVIYVHNDGNGVFTRLTEAVDMPLPALEGLSKLSSTLLADLNGDGVIDIFQPGDLYSALGTNQSAWKNLKASQTITFNAPEGKTTASEPFDLQATSSSGLEVTYTSSNEAVATITGNTVTIVGVGETVITASQVGNKQFAAAEPVTQTLAVAKATGIKPLTSGDINIYHDPATGLVTVEMLSINDKPTQYNVYQLSGGKVLSGKIVNDTWQINMGNQAKGIYYIELLSQNNRYTFKVLVQ
ncbi:MAG: VCBS repeat-containing protein [Marinilabiliaceae bacterium]|nr:VCBS repeat-containing protein [Marinilabiliaceae bacterium]